MSEPRKQRSGHDRRLESMLIDYRTTTATDFRDGEILPSIKTLYKEKLPPCRRVRPQPLKEISTVTDWRIPNAVPFTLFWKLKDNIVHTDPRQLQEPYAEPIDLEKDEVRKTRPRFIATSIGSLDDFPDECRQFMLDDVYQSTTHKDLKNTIYLAGRKINSVKAPLPKKPAPPIPIKLPSFLTPPYISPEWRMDSAAWGNRQLRANCDCTMEFWMSRKPKDN